MKTRRTVFRFGVILLLVKQLVLAPAVVTAQGTIPGFQGRQNTMPPPAANTLPAIQQIHDGSASLEQTAQNQLTVHQNTSHAVLDWSSFNIGANAWVHFDQKGNANWAALNRIFDQNPSQIYGRLTADGKVYLINGNGILFSRGAQVNVHTMAASALQMSAEDFKNDLFRFQTPAGDVTDQWLADTWVTNQGTISVEIGGSVFLLAPNVENSGVIEAPDGNAVLVAGLDFEYDESYSQTGTSVTKTYTVEEKTGTVLNATGGRIQADGGDIRLFGQVVNTDGLIRSVQAVNDRGTIALVATERIHTGPNSRIETPIDRSTETYHQSFGLEKSEITLSSEKDIWLEGTITAPSGRVSVTVEDSEADPGRIYMAEDSRIDVGGLWVDKTAEDQLVEFQLNSVELRDDYGQKDGSLKGEIVTVSQTEGTSVGNTSTHLEARETTTAERATTGGEVILDVNHGDIIIREGAEIDFSGGGLHYQAGTVTTTKLLSGTTLYDISEAPQYMTYEKLVNGHTTTYDRYGQVEKYEGAYYGGTTALRNYSPAFDVGADAGSLTITAPTIILDGALDGSVVFGQYQTEYAERTDASNENITFGMARPQGGSLTIGEGPSKDILRYNTADPVTAEIVVTNSTQAIQDSFGPDTSLADAYGAVNPLQTDYYDDDRIFYRTLLSAETLNNAGLQDITLNAATSLTIDAGATVSLLPKGTFTGTARRVVHEGRIASPGGIVEMATYSNVTIDETSSSYISPDRIGPERVHLASGSSIDVSGERVDASTNLDPNASVQNGYLQGGFVVLKDYSFHGEGVVMESGARIDVSGGYQLSADGSVRGGNSGTVDIGATAIILDGTLAAHSLQGYNGGTLNLQGVAVTIANADRVTELPDGLDPDTTIPDHLLGTLTLGSRELEPTGFTNFDFSGSSLTIADGVQLTPSNTKRSNPFPSDPASTSTARNASVFGLFTAVEPTTAEADPFIELPDVELGATSISLAAGQSFIGNQVDGDVKTDPPAVPGATTNLVISDSVTIAAAPGGSVSLGGRRVDIAGTVSAAGGTISVDGSEAVHLRSGSVLNASGYTRTQDVSLVEGVPADVAVFDAGTVAIEAGLLLQADAGAVVDVSAADTVIRQIPLENGTLTEIPLDGHAGEVRLTYKASDSPGEGLVFDGSILADHADRPGISGGSVSLTGQDGAMTVTQDSLGTVLSDDIDNLTLISRAPDGAIVFDTAGETSFDLGLDGRLILDAVEFKVGGATPDQAHVNLAADAVTIRNSITSNPSLVFTPEAGSASLSIEGRQGMDLDGYVAFSGFDEVALTTHGDMRVTDRTYTINAIPNQLGGIETQGDLALTANRIYPDTLARFSFGAGRENGDGRIDIHGSGDPNTAPIYSAGGQLIFAARDIYHDGTVKAPMGDVLFFGDFTVETSGDQAGSVIAQAADTVTMTGQSITSASGEAVVYYGGELDADNLAWEARIQGGTSATASDVVAAPVGGIRVESDTFVAAAGSTVEAAGGGGIFSYRNDPGIEGTVDPLTKDGRYVILPTSAGAQWGMDNYDSVTFSGDGIIPEGEFAILPAEYAFAEGAIVIEDRGVLDSFADATSLSEEGFQLSVGYFGDIGTDKMDTTPHLFAVRPAGDVLQEGYFQQKSITAGAGGTIQLLSRTNVVEATLNLAALEGFAPGVLEATAGRVLIQADTDVDTDAALVVTADDIPADLDGTLVLNATGLLSGDKGILKLTATDETDGVVRVESGAVLKATDITLTSAKDIDIAASASVEALDTGGVIRLVAGDGGTIAIRESATVHAQDLVSLDTHAIDLSGDIQVDNGNFALAGDTVWMMGDESALPMERGLYLTQSQWDRFAQFDSVTLTSRSGLYLDSGFNLALQGSDPAATGGNLTVDSGWIGAVGETAGQTGRISAGTEGLLTLINSSDAVARTDRIDAGTLSLEGRDVVIGSGDVRIDGYGRVDINARNEIAAAGTGRLDSHGDLHLAATRVTAIPILGETSDGGTTYVAPDFDLSAAGQLFIESAVNPVPVEERVALASATGGRLSLSGTAVSIDGHVETPGATLAIAATSSSSTDSIHLSENAVISAAGNAHGAGGTVHLSSTNGGIDVDSGAQISAAAGDQGDAGTIRISSANGSAVIDGTLSGAASTTDGRGGAFILDAENIGDLTGLAQLMSDGGFTRDIQIRSRQDDALASDMTLADGVTLSAEHVKLAADGGSLNIAGTITTAGTTDGGLIELYAGDTVHLQSTSRISAAGAAEGSKGAEVYVSADTGDIQMDSGARIEVTGTDSTTGGIVYFRARQDGDSPKMSLNGEIAGADQIVAEAFTVYTATSVRAGSGSEAGAVYQDDLMADAATFMSGLNWDTSQLATGGVAVTVAPGIEIRSDGDMDISDSWSLASQRFGAGSDVPGVLTLRADGNLTVAAGVRIEDQPASTLAQFQDSAFMTPTRQITTWGIRMAAGADDSSADPMGIAIPETGNGDLTLADGALVFSHGAPIWFASHGDTNIGKGADVAGYISSANMPANIMTLDKTIRGQVGGSLSIAGGAIQSAVGDIHLDVGDDLTLTTETVGLKSHMGSIRTLGQPAEISNDGYQEYWKYANGGGISLNVGGDLTSNSPSVAGWGQRYRIYAEDLSYTDVWGGGYGADGETHVAADQESVTQGIATMAGGDLTVTAGGSIDTQIGAFADGDVTVTAGKDLDGRFLVTNGSGRLMAQQNFGYNTEAVIGERHSHLDIFDAQFTATAMGSLQIGTVANPGVVSEEFLRGYWNMGYSQDSAVRLAAIQGDVTYSGRLDYMPNASAGINHKRNILPGTVALSAGNDIRIDTTASLYLAPAANGQLELDAGRDIIGLLSDQARSQIVMSETSPDSVYGSQYGTSDVDTAGRITNINEHTDPPLHTKDSQPTRIIAGNDIRNLDFILAESARMTAGGDIRNFGFYAQTLALNQANTIYAAGDIAPQSLVAGSIVETGIESAGPGMLLVQAGGDIDLGATPGIRATGSVRNAFLPSLDPPSEDNEEEYETNALMVVAGVPDAQLMDDLIAAMGELQIAAGDYTAATGSGDIAAAEAILARVETEIEPALLPGAGSGGVVNMTQSEIASAGNATDIYVIAAGEINVGKSAISDEDNNNTGINAMTGGAINIFTRGDLNVNESRIVTFGGGDILAWSNDSDINAGRGSTAEVSASEPRLEIEYDEDGNEVGRKIVFDPPAVGSGIRALTFDPDGANGPIQKPDPGDVYLVAPKGTIDAGEAGIKGNNVFLAAQEVVNAQNIDVSGASVGVPDTAAAAGSVAALAGAGAVSETAKMAEESGAMKSAEERFKTRVDELSKSLVPRWIAVEVVGFDENESPQDAGGN